MFNFGKNWDEYSLQILDAERLQTAQASLADLLAPTTLTDKTFLDIGCGSGIFTIGAASLSASEALGIDVNPSCIRVSQQNKERFLESDAKPLRFDLGNALDAAFMESLGVYDIVYAWGSLHHSGDMYTAIKNTAQCVAPDGVFVLAIYNTHITSGAWTVIKWLYNKMPSIIQRLMVLILGGVIYLAKWIVTRKNPLDKERGMEFWIDVVDWVGGYPYQHATPDEIQNFVEPLGFKLEKAVPPPTPTGCNEFVFRRVST